MNPYRKTDDVQVKAVSRPAVQPIVLPVILLVGLVVVLIVNKAMSGI